MTLEAWLTILAILLGPVVALGLQRFIERRREQQRRKHFVFRELMITRGTRLSPRHVEALNAIEVEFDAKDRSERKVINALKEYFDVLNERADEEPQQLALYQRRDERFIELLYELSNCLGYRFDRVSLKRNIYTPVGHGEVEDELRLIRKGIVDLLSAKTGLNVRTWLMAGPHPYPVQMINQPIPPAQVQVEPPPQKQPLAGAAAKDETSPTT
jgi:Family of unknown function (DUF6680)